MNQVVVSSKSILYTYGSTRYAANRIAELIAKELLHEASALELAELHCLEQVQNYRVRRRHIKHERLELSQ